MALRQLVDLGHKAAGRQADVAHTDVDALRAGDDLQKVHHIIKIVQRLTDAHQNNVGDALAGVLLCGVNFRRDLPRRQVAHAARLGGGAEPAAHCAAHLGGHTDSIAVFVAHEHGLDAVAVGQLQKILDRTVPRLLAAADDGGCNRALLLQLGQQRLGLVGHLGELRHKLLVQPFKNLLGAEFWLTQSHDVGRQRVQRQVGNADFFAHAGSPPFIRTSLQSVSFQDGGKKTVRPGSVGQKQRAQRRDVRPRQRRLWQYNVKIRIGGEEFLHLGLILLIIHCTGRIHQTAIFGK